MPRKKKPSKPTEPKEPVTGDEPTRVKVADGPTTGYRDGQGGAVETANFPDGWLPAGWEDSPAKCKNCDGKSHPEYVQVEA